MIIIGSYFFLHIVNGNYEPVPPVKDRSGVVQCDTIKITGDK
jgi:hypothetical protein